MADADDQHNEPVVIWLVENPVVPDTQPVAIAAAAQLHRISGARFIGQTIDDGREPFPYVSCQLPELSSRRRGEL
jgi:hypothetical protein